MTTTSRPGGPTALLRRMADGTVRPVYEANVVDTGKGAALAHTVLVDAVTGEVLVRRNRVDNSQGVENFQGSFTATECGPKHPFELTDGKTRSIALSAISTPATGAPSPAPTTAI